MSDQAIAGAEDLIGYKVSFYPVATQSARCGYIRVVYVGGSNNNLRLGILGDDGELYDKAFCEVKMA